MHRRRRTEVFERDIQLQDDEKKLFPRSNRHTNIAPTSIGRLREKLDLSNIFNKENIQYFSRLDQTEPNVSLSTYGKRNIIRKRQHDRQSPNNVMVTNVNSNDSEESAPTKLFPLTDKYTNFQDVLTELRQKTFIRKSPKETYDKLKENSDLSEFPYDNNQYTEPNTSSSTIPTIDLEKHQRIDKSINSSSLHGLFRRVGKSPTSDRDPTHDEIQPTSNRQFHFHGLTSVPFFGNKLGNSPSLHPNQDNSSNTTIPSIEREPQSFTDGRRSVIKRNMARFRMLSVRRHNSNNDSNRLSLRRTKSTASYETKSGNCWEDVDEAQNRREDDTFTSNFENLTQLRNMRRALIQSEQALSKLTEESRQNRTFYEMEIMRLKSLYKTLDQVQEIRHKQTLEVLDNNYKVLDFLERKFGYLISTITKSGHSNIQEAFNRIGQIVFNNLMTTAFKIVQFGSNYYYRRQRGCRPDEKVKKA